MRRKAVVVLSTILAIGLPASQAMSAAICGTADNAQGNPAQGVSVVAKSPSGQIEGQGTTDANGNYRIDGLNVGTLDLFLEPGSSGLQAGSGVLDLNDKSKRVNWQLSSASSAVASQAGPCDDAAAALTPLEWGAIGVLGLAVGGGIAAIVWDQTGNREDHESASPNL
ncbi:MAG TPA: carboxypeptidase-like regulatory domain-containing protein [Candidatus Binataceae bacterium]|nr:carboxypeptidase-like regulatory domain-containing protein [Candidatus Binataceae bacterium]